MTFSEIKRNKELILALSDPTAYLNGFSQPFAASFVMRRERPARRDALFIQASYNIRYTLGRSVLRVHGSLQDLNLLLAMRLAVSSTQNRQ
jgi:hypothetical protein